MDSIPSCCVPGKRGSCAVRSARDESTASQRPGDRQRVPSFTSISAEGESTSSSAPTCAARSWRASSLYGEVRSGGAVVSFSSFVVGIALPSYTAYAATEGAVDTK